ncbi:MAG: AI-2E family transporter, partial [Brevundimonas sp.]
MKLPLTSDTAISSRNAIVTIAVVAAGASLYWLRDILTPLAMSIFLMIMISGIERWLSTKGRIPDRFAGAAAICLVVLGFLASIWSIIDGAAGFFT